MLDTDDAVISNRRIASIQNVMEDCMRHMKIEDDMADALEKEFAGRMSEENIRTLVAGHRGVANLWRVQVGAYRLQLGGLRGKR